MAFQKTVHGPTPAGGVRSQLTFLDRSGNPVDESVAVCAIGIEYDAAGNELKRSYLILRKPQVPTPTR